jgi:D-alanyl-lipoteichoic acid acyltransferase DltB (MBOAT superfamily)
LVYLFFDFAGYSLIALGIGRLCGIPTPVNFDRPFASATVTEFWTRWHISLGAIVRNNLYLPLQIALVRRLGIRHSAAIAFFTTSASFAFVGLWHRLSPMFLVWGLLLGLAMAIEKPVRNRLAASPRWRTPAGAAAGRILGPIYVFVLVSASLQLVAQEVM